MRKSIWKIIAPVILLVCAALIGIRIYNVNKDVELPPVEVYPEGEYVALGDNYFWQENEMSPGYEVKVISSKVITYESFIKEYGAEIDYLDEGYRPEYIIDLEVSVRNNSEDTNDSSRGIDLIQTILESNKRSFQTNSRLLGLCSPNLENQVGFRVRPGTEFHVHLPFTQSPSMDPFTSVRELSEEDYYLVLTMYPVKKVIKIDLS